MKLALPLLLCALLGACSTGVYQPSGRAPQTTNASTGSTSSSPSGPPPFPAPGSAPGASAPGGPDYRAPGPIPRSDPNAATESGGAVARLPEAPVAVTGPTAALLVQSQTQRDNGDFDRAAQTLERAIAISPEAPLLWVELAEIRMLQGSPALAQETARKALTLTGDDATLAARARRLIPR